MARILEAMMNPLLKTLFAALMLGCGACGVPSDELVSALLFAPGDGGSKYYRIPALVTADDGSLVAVADRRLESMGDLPNKIDIVMRRSTDGGRTWSPASPIVEHRGECGYGDAALVSDARTGELLCIFASGRGMWDTTPETPIDINVCRSGDFGRTWSEPERVTPQLWGSACPNPVSKGWYGAFAASGRALQLRDGTLLFVVAARTGEAFPPLANYVCMSEDGGRHWTLLPTPADMNGDEAKLVERADGSWLMSIRNPAKGRRKYAVSVDRGATWSEPRRWEDMPSPACNGDIVRYTLRTDGFERDRMLHSIPLDSAERRNVSVLLSYDEGLTWPVRRTVWSGDAGYSSLTVLPDGDIGLLTEVGNWDRGFEIYFTRLTPEWLTEGADSYR